ncbi:hypothetical protein P7996_15960, partial [Staphylococcus aureus]|nr:hypothetical protein [Staphylococcus aureus]
ENEEAYIIMDCQIGNNKPNCPFIINMQLTGVFDIEYENDVEENSFLDQMTVGKRLYSNQYKNSPSVSLTVNHKIKINEVTS